MFSNKGLFGFRMRNKILRRSEKIETRSKKHDFSDRNSPVYLIQLGLLAVYRTPVHVQCCFVITQKLLLEASKTNTSFSRLSASSSYVSLDLQQDNIYAFCFDLASVLLSRKLKLLPEPTEGSQTNTSASFSSLTTCRTTSVSYLSFLALPIGDT